MESTKVSKLLLAWLWTQGHKVKEYEEGKGISTAINGQDFRFDLCGTYGGYRVVYNNNLFSFYDGDTKLKDTDLNEFR